MGALELSSLLVYGGLGSPSWHGRVSTRLARDQARKYKEKGDLEFDSSLFEEDLIPLCLMRLICHERNKRHLDGLNVRCTHLKAKKCNPSLLL